MVDPEFRRWAKSLVARINKAMEKHAHALREIAGALELIRQCPTCGALTTAESETAHAEWHRQQEAE